MMRLIWSFQTLELRAYLKELGGEISSENVGEPIKDLLDCIEASDVCWKEINNETGNTISYWL